MKQRNKKLDCEMSYPEKLKSQFKENSMVYKFYLWLSKNKLKEDKPKWKK